MHLKKTANLALSSMSKFIGCQPWFIIVKLESALRYDSASLYKLQHSMFNASYKLPTTLESTSIKDSQAPCWKITPIT